MGALQKAQSRATALARQLGTSNGTTFSGAAMQAASVGAGAFAAGYLDSQVGDIAGQRPSVMLGVGAAVAGVMLRQPLLVRAAAGALSPVAYEAGLSMGKGQGQPAKP